MRMGFESGKYIDFARDTAIRAGGVTLDYFRKGIRVENKSDMSPVTVADRETEQFIRREIQKKFPGHGIIGEEFGVDDSGSPFRWIIDPIDGTKSFIRGIPLYTVLIALEYEGEPVIGVIHNPFMNETVWAASGTGCFFNGTRCRVGEKENIGDALVLVTDCAHCAKNHPGFFSRLMQISGQCRTWGDAYGYLMVATGRADAMIDPVLKIWDVAPLRPIITEAGGAFTDIHGSAAVYPESAVAANKAIHDSIINLMKE